MGKGIVLGLSEPGDRKKAIVVSDTERKTILKEINRHVRKGTTLSTDEATHYIGVSRHGYKYRTCCHSAKNWVNGRASTNDVEMMWALLKRAFFGIYHQFSMKHLPKYIGNRFFV